MEKNLKLGDSEIFNREIHPLKIRDAVIFLRDAFNDISKSIGRGIEIPMGQRGIISSDNNNHLITYGVANCKAIVLVHKDVETGEISYSLEHATPESSPDMSPKEGCEIIGKYWINGGASSMRYDRSIEKDFGGNSFSESDGEMTIEYRKHSGVGKTLSVDVIVHPKTKRIIVGIQ